MCEHMSATEKAQMVQDVLKKFPERAGDGSPFPEMWLCYPPLAGRHLSVVTGGMEKEIVVGIMGKERFLVKLESREVRDEVLEDLQNCINFAAQGMSNRFAIGPCPTHRTRVQQENQLNPAIRQLRRT
jgi:hypothetical protein